MTKVEYLGRLRAILKQMPPEEQEKQLAYYEELLSDMIEDGMSEEEATEHLGTPETVAAELMAEMPLTTLVKNRVKANGKPSALTVVLLVMGAPLWLPLLLAAAAILLALVITLWAVGLSIGVVLPAVGAGGILLGVGTLLSYASLPLLMALGSALIGTGVLILGVLLLGVIVRALARLCRSIWRGCKRALVK